MGLSNPPGFGAWERFARVEVGGPFPVFSQISDIQLCFQQADAFHNGVCARGLHRVGTFLNIIDFLGRHPETDLFRSGVLGWSAHWLAVFAESYKLHLFSFNHCHSGKQRGGEQQPIPARQERGSDECGGQREKNA